MSTLHRATSTGNTAYICRLSRTVLGLHVVVNALVAAVGITSDSNDVANIVINTAVLRHVCVLSFCSMFKENQIRHCYNRSP